MLNIVMRQIRSPNGDYKVPALKPKIIRGKKVLVPLKRGEMPSLDVMPHWTNRSGIRNNILPVKRGTFNLPIKISPYQTPDFIPKKPIQVFRSSPKMRPDVQPRTPIPIKKIVTVKPVIVKAKLIKPNLVKAVIKNPITKQIKTVIASPGSIKAQTRPVQITVTTGQKPVEKSTLEKFMVPIGIGLITLMMKG